MLACMPFPNLSKNHVLMQPQIIGISDSRSIISLSVGCSSIIWSPLSFSGTLESLQIVIVYFQCSLGQPGDSKLNFPEGT